MKILNTYLTKEKIKKVQFAKTIGISREYLHSILNGKKNISPKLASAIEKATNGEIKAEWLIFPEKYQDEIDEYIKTYSVDTNTAGV